MRWGREGLPTGSRGYDSLRFSLTFAAPNKAGSIAESVRMKLRDRTSYKHEGAG